MPVVSPEHVRDDLLRSAHHRAGVRPYTLDAARILRRAVPFDGVCLVTMDPATFLPTAEIVQDALPPALRPRMTEIEVRAEDVNSFRALAHSRTPAASLSETTAGKLERSVAYRELKRPHGFGDELRAVLKDGPTVWGGLTLLRGLDRDPFSRADAMLLASLARILAEGVRRTLLLDAATADRSDDGEPVGLALLASDDSLTSINDAAEWWLAELGEGARGEPLPPAVRAVAYRARSIADGRESSGSDARVRVRTASGRWLLVRGSVLGDDNMSTAVTFESARAHDLAPLIADAYELTGREREVTQLVAHGLATEEIAARLHLSPWTVQDHLKAIFDKTGASSRVQLIARLFFEHYEPRLTDPPEAGSEPAATRWRRGSRRPSMSTPESRPRSADASQIR